MSFGSVRDMRHAMSLLSGVYSTGCARAEIHGFGVFGVVLLIKND